jgi:hypothetical protein
MRWRTTAALAAVACSGASLLFGALPVAASSSPSAKTIVSNAIAAWKSVRSVHVVGSIDTTKEQLNLDVRASSGPDGTGTIGLNGGEVKIVRLGALVYFEADVAFWTQNVGASAATFAGRWVSTSSTGSTGKNFAQLADSTALFKQILSGSKVNQSRFTRKPNTTVAGVPVYAISGTNTKSGSHGTVYVARTGTPYIIELDTTSSAGMGELTFSAYNKPVRAAVPPHAITLQKLEQEAAAAPTES